MITSEPEIKLEDIKFAHIERGLGKQDSFGQHRDLQVNVVRFSTPCFSIRINENTDLLVVIEDKGQTASTVLREARSQLSELFKSLAKMLDDDGWEGRE